MEMIIVVELEATGRLEMSLFHTFEAGKIGHPIVPIAGKPVATDGFLGPRAGPDSPTGVSGGVTAVRTCEPATGVTGSPDPESAT
jgi:hypothetical protein